METQCNHELVFFGEGQQYVPKTASLSDNFFEKAVLHFEAHCPQGRQWSKFPYELRIMLNEVVFGN